MKGSVDYHNRVDFRALDVFVAACHAATREELTVARSTARERSRDFAVHATERKTWARLATLLGGELRGFEKIS